MTTLDYIPAELKSLPQWVVWRAEPRDGKLSKVPYRLDGRRANVTNSDDWTTFDRAVSAASRFSGIGFVFSKEDEFTGIDLDHVIGEDGDTAPWVLRTVGTFNCYCTVGRRAKVSRRMI